MPGPPPKPTRLKVLQGNPGKRSLPKGEPRPEPGIPTRPHWLSPEAKREWTRVVPELARLGLLAKIDRGMIAAYCQSWAMYVAAVKKARRSGMTYVTEKGYEGQAPSIGISVRMMEKMIAFSARFGFTPSDRSRLSAPELDEVDPLAEFLQGKEKGDKASRR